MMTQADSASQPSIEARNRVAIEYPNLLVLSQKQLSLGILKTKTIICLLFVVKKGKKEAVNLRNIYKYWSLYEDI